MKKVLITLAVIVLIFTACKDEPTCPTPTPAVIEEEVEADFIGSFEWDPAGIYNYIYTFNEDGTYRLEMDYYKDGDTIVYSGTWEINSKVQLCEETTTVFIAVDKHNSLDSTKIMYSNFSLGMSGPDTLNFYEKDLNGDCYVWRTATRVK